MNAAALFLTHKSALNVISSDSETYPIVRADFQIIKIERGQRFFVKQNLFRSVKSGELVRLEPRKNGGLKLLAHENLLASVRGLSPNQKSAKQLLYLCEDLRGRGDEYRRVHNHITFFPRLLRAIYKAIRAKQEFLLDVTDAGCKYKLAYRHDRNETGGQIIVPVPTMKERDRINREILTRRVNCGCAEAEMPCVDCEEIEQALWGSIPVSFTISTKQISELLGEEIADTNEEDEDLYVLDPDLHEIIM